MKTLIYIILGIFLVATVAEGQGPQWRVYTPQNSGLPFPSIRALATEKDSLERNIIWMGVGGLTKFDGIIWTVYNSTNSGMVGGAWTIALDQKNSKWIGSNTAGITKFDGLTWNHYDTSNSPIPAQWIWEIFIDKNDTKWIGTGFSGLVKFEDTTWTVYNEENSGIPGRRIRGVSSVDDILWIGTDGNGVGKLEDTSWTNYDTSNSGLTNDDISDIDIDGKGNKWILTFGGGLNKFNSSDTVWTYFPGPGTCLLIDEKRNVKWMGSPGGGLFKFYNDSIMTNYRPENSPMPDYTVNDLSLDSSGNLWIATNGGLAVFNESGIVGVDDPAIINVPVSAKLFQNYPNPFNPTTRIRYELRKPSLVELKIYNSIGAEIQTLANEYQQPKSHEVVFYAFDNLSSGVYYYVLKVDGVYTNSKKFVYLK